MFTFNTNIIYKLPDYIPNLNIELSSPEKLIPKHRPPQIKKDPILDAPDEIKKWLEQRRKRYPNKDKPQIDENAQELSILEQKLRKKISILSGSSRRTQIKAKQMKELCKVLTESKRIKKKLNNEPLDQSSDSESSNQQEEDKKLDDKESIQKEISKLQKKLTDTRPKEYFKKIKEGGGEQQQLTKMEKQIIKKKIKDLKIQLKQLNPEAEQVQEQQQVKRQENTQSLEDHTKEMIGNLEDQQEKMENLLEESLNYRVNPANFRYKSNTLYTNMLIGEIYRERQYILQAIRYLVKENFFEEKGQEGFECITSESEQVQEESSEEEQEFMEENEEYF
ncbi:unnamed protein product [Paramecium sonneborni]|uniref:FMR1-interacting protein 1 conserved domain-containing protein n=1 Tax=Paramecium sonneborni TaxID=65129 RepID=A0A8S1R0E0_9CILI|nr:unnamed protein product [Paramecium sonneborni]